MTKKWVYLLKEGNASMRDLLGGKGAGLAEMANAGLPVPPSFTISTEACNKYNALGKKFPPGMWEQTLEAMKVIEKESGKGFGDPTNPLLVSVRSGARVSMPGMMDTVLNLGLNAQTLEGLAKATGNERFAWDAYRRFIQMFGRIVMGVKAGADEEDPFEQVMREYKAKTEGGQDTDLTTDMLKEIAAKFKAIIKQRTGKDFPEDPYEQLCMAIAAVFDSWMGRRAVDYRNFHKLPHDWGTAVSVVTMIFGNMGFDSGTGVAFTRDPATGEKVLYGEYLLNAQGEDVVAGIRTPKKIAELKNDMPEVYEQFAQMAGLLEKHYRDVQDLEFTIERGRLWMLQTRSGKRTARAAVKIAVDMVKEGLITKEEAVLRVEPEQVDQLLHPRFGAKDKEAAAKEGRLLARGLNASPGAAVGFVVFDADRAAARARKGENVILTRPETSPEDVHGMLAAKGILTQHGGATSHAAVVARGVGKPCVAGCEALEIDLERRRMIVNSRVIEEGDYISIDGTTGEVFAGRLPTTVPNFAEEKDLQQILKWADEIRRLGVWTNADYPRDARRAREFGAEGIGLCRTEHMFFEEERRPIVQRMIMARGDEKKRQEALDQLLPFQRADFEGIFEAMDGLPVIIRLIDPPMHEFLPPREQLIEEVTELRCGLDNNQISAKERKPLEKELTEKEEMLRVVESLWEVNPMLGLRGCRAGIMYKGLTEMQVRAIFQAACRMAKKGVEVHPEIMIPLVGHVNELQLECEKLEKVAKEVMAEEGIEVDYKFGTMIEVPRAALTADEIAKYAEFFSFGTNDLTQMTFGISRDDAEGKFLLEYVERKILPANPFQQLDREGVGQLMRMCVEKARQTRPDIEIGICGEHGGDPSSIEFCYMIGLNYVSCSPFRVPVARLAAAHAALREGRPRDVD